jgi:hypothetical protein
LRRVKLPPTRGGRSGMSGESKKTTAEERNSHAPL